MKPYFRLATTEDVPVLLTMMERFYSIDAYAFKAELSLQNLHTFISNPSLGRMWLILLDTQTIGYVILTFGFSFEFGGKDAFLDELFVDAPFRGKGAGKEAVRFVLREAPGLGVKAVHLEVEKHNKAGQELYRSFGFKDHHRYMMTRLLP